MDSTLKPEVLKEQARQMEAERQKPKQFPEQPERDVLLFLLENAQLNHWQRDVLGIVRDEAYYFAPQGQTKIMNEGWASYWHSTIMTTRTLKPSELVDYADHHSGTMATQPGRLNPYKLGIELFRDIEERWNKGQFGQEYEECDDTRLALDTKGLGRQKIFSAQDPQRRDVRRHLPDARFLQAISSSASSTTIRRGHEIESRSSRRSRIVHFRADQLRSADHPLKDGNYRNREDSLHRDYFGVDLNSTMRGHLISPPPLDASVISRPSSTADHSSIFRRIDHDSPVGPIPMSLSQRSPPRLRPVPTTAPCPAMSTPRTGPNGSRSTSPPRDRWDWHSARSSSPTSRKQNGRPRRYAPGATVSPRGSRT